MKTQTILHRGAYQRVLRAYHCDLLLADTPYSERTHKGHDGAAKDTDRTKIGYKFWTPRHVSAFVRFWHPRTRGWMVTITDHVLGPVWERAMRKVGRYVFAPIPFVAPGSRVRMRGDGPSNWTTWIYVSRPRRKPYSEWGTLRGAYVLPKGTDDLRDGTSKAHEKVQGAKPLWLGRQLVRDYSRPGEIVLDPTAGRGTFLAAAELEGRDAIGAEQDEVTAKIAQHYIERVRARFQRSLPGLEAEPHSGPAQGVLLTGINAGE